MITARCSHQWLKTYPERSRQNHPDQVTIDVSVEPSEWEKEFDLVAHLEIQRKASAHGEVYSRGEYQQVYFDQNTLDRIVPVLMKIASEPVRSQFILDMLSKLNDSAMLDLIEAARAKRETVQPKHAPALAR